MRRADVLRSRKGAVRGRSCADERPMRAVTFDEGAIEMDQQQFREQSPQGTSRRRALTSIAVAGLGAAGLAVAGGGRTAAAQTRPGSVDEIIQSWPEKPSMAAR